MFIFEEDKNQYADLFFWTKNAYTLWREEFDQTCIFVNPSHKINKKNK